MAHKAWMMGVATAAVVVSAGSALAGGFALREQSAYSQGASFAGAAAPGDSISAMFWNPAAVTNAEGLVTESHSTFISPRSELDVDPTITPLSGLGLGNGGDVGIDAYVPSGYVAYQVNEQLYLGMSVNGPFGLATRSDLPWVGQFDHHRAKVFSINAAPTIGWKVNEMISIGVGAQIQYFDVGVKTAVSGPPANALQEIEGDDFGFGFTAGVTLTPFDGTEIGVGYRSGVSHTLEGTQTLPGLPAFGISADVDLPDTVTIGLRQRVSDSFTLLAGAEWANWSKLGTIPLEGSPVGAELEFEYEDGWYFSLGGEYAWNEALTLRAGVGYEISPVQDEFRSMRLPDNDRIWASIGASYQINDQISVDAAYSHLFVEDAFVDQTPLGNPGLRYGGTADGDIDIIAVSLRYKLGG